MNTQNNNSPYPKGSEWRKWDLQLHTPASFVNLYGNDATAWESFLRDLESLPPEFCVLGINDYLFIDGYKRVKEEKEKNNRLKNIALLLPVIEFRIKKFSGSENKLSRVNFHVIFSPDIDVDIIQQHFLNAIPQHYELTPKCEQFRTQWKALATKQSLEELGKKIKSTVPKAELAKYGTDMQEGFNNINFDENKIIQVLESSHYFKGKYFTAIGKTEWSDIKWDDNSIADKKDVINKVDFVFISAENPNSFYSSKSQLTKSNVNDLLLDCSDAHRFSNSTDKDRIGKCFTWIKADPTFEGLKQILYEPKSRVYIGEEPPSKVESGKVIKSIKVQNSNGWFEEKEIELNSNLVSIIGGRGTGKTALLDVIALAANKDWNEIESNENSFLRKANSKFPGLKITLKWMDNTEDSFQLNEDRHGTDIAKKVTYLSQGFVTQLCSDEYVAKLQEQIENVIYQKVEDEHKAIYSDFKTFKKSQLDAISLKRNQIKKQIQNATSKIVEAVDLLLDKPRLNSEITKKEEEHNKVKVEITKLSESIAQKNKANESLLKKYNESNEQKVKLEEENAKTAEQIRNVDQIAEEYQDFETDIETKIEDINQKLKQLGVQEKLKVTFSPPKLAEILNTAKSEKKNILKNKAEALVKIKADIAQIVTKLNLEKTRQTKLTELILIEKKTGQEIVSLKRSLEKCGAAEQILPNLREEQKNCFAEFFVTLYEEKTVLEEIYGPLEKTLKSGTEERGLFKFNVKMDFDYQQMAERGDVLINHRKAGIFHNKDQKELLEKLAALKDKILSLDFSLALGTDEKGNRRLANDNARKLESLLSGIMSLFVVDGSLLPEQNVMNQLNQAYSVQNFYNWLFATDYYKLSYSIQFDDKKLDELTPGLKGIALLILYLDLDKDYKPILIDQPEENLDNRSAYTTLVQYFTEAKEKRQVIIVTHNANLVVNTDSEQIVVANFDKNREKQNGGICYVSGALENSFEDKNIQSVLYSRGIRQHCWYILEGGPEAFCKREQKYNFPVNQ
jgi:ABC-type cobalamin/Fe3+-siderophores transport system ATPase subunit